ncbi:MAG: isoleucine--tRNA ligase [Minisyncoccia bacterium]
MAEETKKSEAAKREERILAWWEEQGIFEKTLQKPAPKRKYVFFDGPPFATGLPHYGHIVASVIKDAIPRFFTMQGYHVPRVWGWDCHGLPIENIVEKELGFKHKKDIRDYGIEKFNERCRESVLTYVQEWEKIIPRIGRWADMKNAYKTMDRSFMESVWWVFKQIYDKGLVYEDYRSMHVCPRCETTLSQQEVSEGYKDVKDIAVTVKFKITKTSLGLASGATTETKFDSLVALNAHMLAWTTTPWTLPGNVALAVGKDIEYGLYEKEGEYLIVAISRADALGLENLKGTWKGSELVGIEYEPPFDYYRNDQTLKNRENGWKVYHADFVTEDAGTGIAHEAPAFGADDWELLKKENLPFVQHVAQDGTMKSEVVAFEGMEVKPRAEEDSARLVTDIAVLKYLQEHGTFFAKENITHAYPHCWRCDTPLLNYATSSWFVSVEKIKDNLLASAKGISWSPAHIKEGRWGKWLQGARDWSISRQRFWASVIPLWKCETCKALRVFGSASELEEASDTKVADLHKHVVDEVVVPCACGASMRRIPDVLDTWFDSGSMPYGQKHYPFENKEEFEKTFPAEFIGEGQDQTRAWFYYVHVLAGALFERPAFRNVIVNGIVLAEDGKKMSKKLQNYPDPMQVVNAYGADALRLYLLSSPVVSAENLAFSEDGVDEIAKKIIGRLQNVLAFYELYADKTESGTASTNILDRWIRERLYETCSAVTLGYGRYELSAAVRPLGDFVDDLSVWYVRRSRERFKEEGADREAGCATLRHVLRELSLIMAPAAPFLAEEIWHSVRAVSDVESVHLAAWPQERRGFLARFFTKRSSLSDDMARVRTLASEALMLRQKAGIIVRQPLTSLSILGTLSRELAALLAEEVNVKEVIQNADALLLDTALTSELIKEGDERTFNRDVAEARKVRGFSPHDSVEPIISVSGIHSSTLSTGTVNFDLKKKDAP